MYDAGKVTIGLLIFLLLVTVPFWYNVAIGKADYAPQLEKPANAEQCIRDTEYMTAYHMNLLNEWRDDVVRNNDRFEVATDGQMREKSLSNTCLSCHTSKEKFCDQCHDYLGVEPYCWDCHVIPEELGQ
ncbi:MAG: cytochrome C [Candidatus Zixiibacteriota bacterium]|nr:MAG: cytochrome C [candidate division Zixibacteria bacterium]